MLLVIYKKIFARHFRIRHSVELTVYYGSCREVKSVSTKFPNSQQKSCRTFFSENFNCDRLDFHTIHKHLPPLNDISFLMYYCKRQRRVHVCSSQVVEQTLYGRCIHVLHVALEHRKVLGATTSPVVRRCCWSSVVVNFAKIFSSLTTWPNCTKCEHNHY